MTPGNSRSDKLAQARKRDSTIKRTRSVGTVNKMLDAGQRVSFTAVARQAQVSTWLLYNVPDLKQVVQHAIEKQAQTVMPPNGTKAATPASISITELALAREEIKELRAENGKLIKRLRTTLGTELDRVDRQDLIEQIHELRTAAEQARHERDASSDLANQLRDRVAELEEEVAVVETLNKKYIREINQSRRRDPP